MIKINTTQLHYQKNLNTTENKNTKIKAEVAYIEQENSFNAPTFNLPQSKTISYKYVLEGGVIKVYLVENGVPTECVKRIPLKDADPSILSQVENITFLDIIMILDLQNDEKEKEKNENNDFHHKYYLEYSKYSF